MDGGESWVEFNNPKRFDWENGSLYKRWNHSSKFSITSETYV